MICTDNLTEYVMVHQMQTIEVTKSTNLKDLVALANRESEIVLTLDNQPVAKVLPIALLPNSSNRKPGSRTLGLHRGAWLVGDDFDKPLPDEFWLGQK